MPRLRPPFNQNHENIERLHCLPALFVCSSVCLSACQQTNLYLMKQLLLITHIQGRQAEVKQKFEDVGLLERTKSKKIYISCQSSFHWSLINQETKEQHIMKSEWLRFRNIDSRLQQHLCYLSQSQKPTLWLTVWCILKTRTKFKDIRKESYWGYMNNCLYELNWKFSLGILMKLRQKAKQIKFFCKSLSRSNTAKLIVFKKLW